MLDSSTEHKHHPTMPLHRSLQSQDFKVMYLYKTRKVSDKSKLVANYQVSQGNLQSLWIIKLYWINHYRWGCWIQSRSQRKNQILKDFKKKEQTELNTSCESVIGKLSLLSITMQQQTKLMPPQNFLHHLLPLTCFLSYLFILRMISWEPFLRMVSDHKFISIPIHQSDTPLKE